MGLDGMEREACGEGEEETERFGEERKERGRGRQQGGGERRRGILVLVGLSAVEVRVREKENKRDKKPGGWVNGFWMDVAQYMSYCQNRELMSRYDLRSRLIAYLALPRLSLSPLPRGELPLQCFSSVVRKTSPCIFCSLALGRARSGAHRQSSILH